jgi:hypothetical protein
MSNKDFVVKHPPAPLYSNAFARVLSSADAVPAFKRGWLVWARQVARLGRSMAGNMKRITRRFRYLRRASSPGAAASLRFPFRLAAVAIGRGAEVSVTLGFAP